MEPKVSDSQWHHHCFQILHLSPKLHKDTYWEFSGWSYELLNEEVWVGQAWENLLLSSITKTKQPLGLPWLDSRSSAGPLLFCPQSLLALTKILRCQICFVFPWQTVIHLQFCIRFSYCQRAVSCFTLTSKERSPNCQLRQWFLVLLSIWEADLLEAAIPADYSLMKLKYLKQKPWWTKTWDDMKNKKL